MADAAALGSDLPEEGSAKVHRIDGNDGRAFGAAVAFERTNAKLIFERFGNLRGEFFRASNDIAKAAEIFGSAALSVSAQKSLRGDEQRDTVLADQRAYAAGIERTGMIDAADADGCGETERGSETEGVKEREDAEDAVVFMQHEDLVELFDVGGDVEVGEQNAFGVAGRAARKDNGGEIVECRLL